MRKAYKPYPGRADTQRVLLRVVPPAGRGSALSLQFLFVKVSHMVH